MIVRVRITKTGGNVLRNWALHRCGENVTIENLDRQNSHRENERVKMYFSMPSNHCIFIADLFGRSVVCHKEKCLAPH